MEEIILDSVKRDERGCIDFDDEELLTECIKKNLPRTGMVIEMNSDLATEMKYHFSPMYDTTFYNEFKRMFDVKIQASDRIDINKILVLGFKKRFYDEEN